MSSTHRNRFPEFREKLIKLGRPKGYYLLWTERTDLSEEENKLCIKVWTQYKGYISLIRRTDRLEFERIYDKVFKKEGVT